MARVHYVERARVRYPTVPVLDGDGKPVTIPVTRRDGSPKTTKRGRPITRRVTRVDTSAEPKPNHTCDRCSREIKPGDRYKWIAPRSGPYGGMKRYRCGSCPTWQVWEYSYSLNARLAEISNTFGLTLNSAESPDDVESALNDAAQSVRDLAEEKRDSAQNIVDGFGHETSTSEELSGIADQLDDWASDIEGAYSDIPEYPEAEEADCEECDGSGELDNEDHDPQDGESEETVECGACEGAGKVTPEEPTEEQVEEWREEVMATLTIVDESPV